MAFSRRCATKTRSTRSWRRGLQVVEPTAPKAQPLAGKAFVFTGALDRLSCREAEQQVEALGARATTAVSAETDYVVGGAEAGALPPATSA
jgi:DNA ligase (NAD+)